MTTSPYDTLPTGKQALTPTSGESIEEKPNPITAPYGGYEEISLEEAARLATPVISQSDVYKRQVFRSGFFYFEVCTFLCICCFFRCETGRC